MLKSYFSIALRNLRRNKTYASINVMGLALSMSCGILLFTLVKYHSSFDNFHTDSDRIYRLVTEQHRDIISYTSSVPSPLGKAIRNDYTFGEKIARVQTFDEQLITIQQGNETKKIKEEEGVAFVETEFFDIFNYPLLQGDKKTVLTEPYTAIITENIAKKYFGNDNPINKVFRVDNRLDFKVTGILKNFPVNTDLKTEIYLSYNSLKAYNEWLASDDAWGGITSSTQCFIKLAKGVTSAQVEKALPAYVTKYRPKSKNVHVYKLQPLADMHFNPDYNGVMEKRNLWVLALIGIFLLVTACVNFINLATAQALKRSKEVGVRKVLGSARKSIFWQFIAETGVITIAACVFAIGLSLLALPYVNDWFESQMSISFISNWQLPVFIIGLIILVTFLAGAYPGLILAGFKPVQALKGKISQQQIGGFNTRRTLIVTQFAISQVLIIGMIVIASQMRYAKQSDLGFRKDAIVMVTMGTGSKLPAMKTMQERFLKIPGVEKVSLCFSAPASGSNWTNTPIFDTRTETEGFNVNVKSSDDQYVPTFDLQLVAGRNLLPSDSVKEMLVNEAFVRKLNLTSPDQVIGKRLALNGGKITGPIVGVLKDFHDRSFHEDISAVCVTQINYNYEQYAVKINMASPKTTIAALGKIWSATHPNDLFEYKFLDERIASFYKTEDLMLNLVRAFSIIAIFIGCLGLYGLVSFMVSQRTKEIGIRKVLGGTMADVLWIFGKEFLRLILIALVIAAPVAWWGMHTWLQDFKFRITISPLFFVWTILLTAGIVLITCGYKAFKASTANPVKALRSE